MLYTAACFSPQRPEVVTNMCADFAAMLAALAQQNKGTFTHCSQSHGFIYGINNKSPV